MSISAMNCTPIKPQASFGSAQGVDEAQKVLELSRQLNDSFTCSNCSNGDCDNEKVTNKNPLQTAISVLGACATMFALGKGAGKGLVALSKKVPSSTKEKILSAGQKAATKIAEQVSKLPKNEKVSSVLSKTVGKAFNSAKSVVMKNPEKSFTTAAGILAASTLVPAITTVDGNKDGVADIAQNNINAYASAFKKAEIFSDIVDALS